VLENRTWVIILSKTIDNSVIFRIYISALQETVSNYLSRPLNKKNEKLNSGNFSFYVKKIELTLKNRRK